MSQNIKLKLSGLDCGHCAEKLESKLKKIINIENVHVSIINNELNIKYSNIKLHQLIDEVKEVSKSLGVNVLTSELLKEKAMTNMVLDKFLKLKLIRYILGIILYAIAIVSNFQYEITANIFILSYIILGLDIILKAIKSIGRKDLFNENFLMSTASLGAIYIGMYSEAVAVILFFQIGEFFQDIAVSRSRKSIKDLMDIKPEYANLIVEGETKKVEPSQVNVGDIILVKAGEKVPLDGIVIKGISQVDASSIIGESVPIQVKDKDTVISGSINLTGAIEVLVTNDYSNSTVSKIMDMIEIASSKKATTERFITKFSKIYTPIVVSISLVLMFVAPLVLGDTEYNDWIYKGLVFLLVSCPCALHLSVPLSFFSGLGNSSRKGVLIKGSNYLQLLSDIDIVAFDKTGTLTKGVFNVTIIKPENGLTENQFIKILATIESYSNHPIAKSILNECEKRNIIIDNKVIRDVKEVLGKGLQGILNEKILLVGNEMLMENNNVNFENYTGLGTVIHMAMNNVYLGFIVISDIIKEDSKIGIEKLKKIGIKKTVMITGDRKDNAYKVANDLGIDEVYAEQLPNEKVNVIDSLYDKYKGEKVAFIGDGINDAPVLSRVDVGIAMGGIGSDAAIEAGDIVIMTDEISKLAVAISVSQKTMSIIKQNIMFVISIKFIVLFLTVIGLGNIWMAVLADTGATLIAILNSIRSKE